MGKLIKAELIRLSKNRTFTVCMIISLLLGVLMAMLYNYAWQNSRASIQTVTAIITQYGMDTKIIDEAFGMIPRDNLWAYINILLSDGSIVYITAVAVSSFAAAEYSMGTLKNTISRGYSRLAVYSSKLTTSLICTYALSFSYVLGGSIVGVINYGFGSTIGIEKMLAVISAYICLFGAMGILYFVFAILCKKSGAAIAVSIVVPLFVASIFAILTMAWNGFKDYSKYWLLNMIVSVQEYILSGEAWLPFVCAAIYFVLSMVIGFAVFKRQDIK